MNKELIMYYQNEIQFLLKRKMNMVQTEIKYLGYDIETSYIKPIQRVIEFPSNFPDELKNKTQL